MHVYGARGPLSDTPQLGEYEVVLAWEAKAAIAAAEQRGREAAYADYLHQKEPFAVWCMEQGAKNQRATFVSLVDAAFAKGEAQGQRDMLAKCIAELEALMAETSGDRFHGFWDALAALRALQEKPTPPPLPPSVGVPEKRGSLW